jgi:hypothetical protein
LKADLEKDSEIVFTRLENTDKNSPLCCSQQQSELFKQRQITHHSEAKIKNGVFHLFDDNNINAQGLYKMVQS